MPGSVILNARRIVWKKIHKKDCKEENGRHVHVFNDVERAVLDKVFEQEGCVAMFDTIDVVLVRDPQTGRFFDSLINENAYFTNENVYFLRSGQTVLKLRETMP